jgi:hypothetical protein
MNTRLFAHCTIACATLLGITSANASTIVHDSITGANMTGYGQSAGYFAPFDRTTLTGQRFTASVSGYIDALTLSANGQSHFDVGLFADDGGQLGDSLQTLALTGAGMLTLATGSYGGGVRLEAGSSYWLVLGMDFAQDSWWYMDTSALPAGGAMLHGEASGRTLPSALQYSDTTGWISTLGLVVSIDDGRVGSVPEPSSYALVGLGLLVTAAAQRRRANAQA